METVEIIWKRLVANSGLDQEILIKLWREISAAYSLKGRYYHTLIHVKKMLESSIKYSDNILDLSNLQLAVIYHDVVYFAHKNDNEEQSAEFAKKHLKQLRFSTQAIKKCCSYILATKGHGNDTNDCDLDYLLDFDLEILGLTWDEYEAYSKQIRLEYKIYPRLMYNNGRKKVLKHFLNQPMIFKTRPYQDMFEKQARKNLEKELSII